MFIQNPKNQVPTTSQQSQNYQNLGEDGKILGKNWLNDIQNGNNFLTKDPGDRKILRNQKNRFHLVKK